MNKDSEQVKSARKELKVEIADTTTSERHAQIDETSKSSMNAPSFENKFPIRKRKMYQVPWNKSDMDQAVEVVCKRKMTLTSASQTFHVPRSTLHDYVKKLRGGMTMVCYRQGQLDQALHKVLTQERNVNAASEEFSVPRSTLYDQVRKRRRTENCQGVNEVDLEDARTGYAKGLAVETRRVGVTGEVSTTKTRTVFDNVAAQANSNEVKVKKAVKRPRGAWKQEDMLKAFQAVKEKRMTIREASKLYNIPNSTLGDRLTGKTGLVTQRRKSRTSKPIGPKEASGTVCDSGASQVIAISESTTFSEVPTMSYVNPLSVSTTNPAKNVAVVQDSAYAGLKVPPSEPVYQSEPISPVSRQDSRPVSRQDFTGPSLPSLANTARGISESTHVSTASSSNSLPSSSGILSVNPTHGHPSIKSKTVSTALLTSTSASHSAMTNDIQQTWLVRKSKPIGDTLVSPLRSSRVSPLNSPNTLSQNLPVLPGSRTCPKYLSSTRCLKCLHVSKRTHVEALQTFETFLTERQLSQFAARYQERAQFKARVTDTLYELWFKLRAAADTEQSAGRVPQPEPELTRSQSPDITRRRKGKPKKRLGNRDNKQSTDGDSKSSLTSESDEPKGKSESTDETNQIQELRPIKKESEHDN